MNIPSNFIQSPFIDLFISTCLSLRDLSQSSLKSFLRGRYLGASAGFKPEKQLRLKRKVFTLKNQ